jgi:branched-chain amino acid transport system substrate-binding protein
VEFYKADAPYDDLPTAITMFRKLARDPDVPVIFDGGATTVILAVHDLAGQFKAPLFAFSTAGTWTLPGFNPYVFRYLPMAQNVMPHLIPKAKAKFNIKKAALIYAHDDEYPVSNAKVLRKVAKDNGIELVEQTYKSKETDFSGQLTAIKAANVNAFFLAGQPFDLGLMMLQARELGLNQPVITDAGGSHPDYWKMSKGKVGETILFSWFNPEDSRPMVRDFLADYKAKYGSDPSSWGALTYDAALVLAHVMNRSGDLTREAIRNSFATTRGLETLSGVVGWEGSGESLRQEALLVHWSSDGKLVPLPKDFWK